MCWRLICQVVSDPFYPSTVLVVDKQGQETITLPDEVSFI